MYSVVFAQTNSSIINGYYSYFVQTVWLNVSICRGEILNFSSELVMLNWLLYGDSEAVVLPSN